MFRYEYNRLSFVLVRYKYVIINVCVLYRVYGSFKEVLNLIWVVRADFLEKRILKVREKNE